MNDDAILIAGIIGLINLIVFWNMANDIHQIRKKINPKQPRTPNHELNKGNDSKEDSVNNPEVFDEVIKKHSNK